MSADYKNNKFYIGSPAAVTKNYGKPTLDEAIDEAARRLQKDPSLDEVFIVKVTKIIRRKRPEVEVLDVE